MNILILATGDNLPLHREIDDIQLHHTCDVVSGGGDLLERFSEYMSRKKYDAVVLSCHYSPETQHFKIGDKNVHVDTLSILIRRQMPELDLLYLNACGTALIAPYFIEEGIPAVMSNGYSTSSNDVDCWSYAKSVFLELGSNGGDIKAAYQAAKTRKGELVLSTNGRFADDLMEPVLKKIAVLEIGNSQIRKATKDHCKYFIAFGIVLVIGTISLIANSYGLWFLAQRLLP